jgi:hypothetical protein
MNYPILTSGGRTPIWLFFVLAFLATIITFGLMRYQNRHRNWNWRMNRMHCQRGWPFVRLRGSIGAGGDGKGEEDPTREALAAIREVEKAKMDGWV